MRRVKVFFFTRRRPTARRLKNESEQNHLPSHLSNPPAGRHGERHRRPGGLLVVFAVACGMSFFPSTYSDKIILKCAELGNFRQRNIPPSVGCSVALSHQTETTLKESGQ